MTTVKRWFAANTTTDEDLKKTIAKVLAGIKKMANTLNNNMVLITDMPSYRTDPNHDLEEAFMLDIGGKSEMPRTVYIEKALFKNYDISVLHDMKKNWTRVLVHEVSHIDGRTEDHRYAYAAGGIAPVTGGAFTPEHAASNADSWAFFAADCGGALTNGDRTRALGGTGGALTELAKNWS